MTALNRTPENPNFLHPNKFRLTFARIPEVQFFCQSVILPGISMTEIMRNTPFVDLWVPGEKAIYDLLSVTMYLDEEMKTWQSIHDWIRAMTFPTDFAEYRNLPNVGNTNGIPNIKKPQYSEATLTLLTASNNPKTAFKFIDIFPTTLTSVPLSATDTPDTPVTVDVTFRYQYYDMVNIQ